MNDEITKAQARIILLFAERNFKDHVEACSECEWVELDDDDADLQMCERAFELSDIESKWRRKALGIKMIG